MVIVFFWWQVPELNLLTALLTAMIDGDITQKMELSVV